MRLPDSITPYKNAFVVPDQEYNYQEEEDVSCSMEQTMSINIPFRCYPRLVNFQQVHQQKQKIMSPALSCYPLEYKTTLKTFSFFQEWAPGDYMTGIFSNASYWNQIMEFYEKMCTTRELYLLVAVSNKSHLFLSPFLRSGQVPDAFLKRARTWFSHPDIYGFFPFYFQLRPDRRSYTQFLRDVLPLVEKKHIREAVQAFVGELDHVFQKCPSLGHDLVVYRGIKERIVQKTWMDKSYVSTTIHPLHAFLYKNPRDACCVQRIVVPSGIKVLFLEGISSFKKEWEILLPRGLTFRLVEEQTRQVPCFSDWEDNHPKRFITVTLQQVVIMA